MLRLSIKQFTICIGLLLASCCKIPLVECFGSARKYSSVDFITRDHYFLQNDKVTIRLQASISDLLKITSANEMFYTINLRFEITNTSEDTLFIFQNALKINFQIDNEVREGKISYSHLPEIFPPGMKRRPVMVYVEIQADGKDERYTEIWKNHILYVDLNHVKLGEDTIFLQPAKLKLPDK